MQTRIKKKREIIASSSSFDICPIKLYHKKADRQQKEEQKTQAATLRLHTDETKCSVKNNRSLVRPQMEQTGW